MITINELKDERKTFEVFVDGVLTAKVYNCGEENYEYLYVKDFEQLSKIKIDFVHKDVKQPHEVIVDEDKLYILSPWTNLTIRKA